MASSARGRPDPARSNVAVQRSVNASRGGAAGLADVRPAVVVAVVADRRSPPSGWSAANSSKNAAKAAEKSDMARSLAGAETAAVRPLGTMRR